MFLAAGALKLWLSMRLQKRPPPRLFESPFCSLFTLPAPIPKPLLFRCKSWTEVSRQLAWNVLY